VEDEVDEEEGEEVVEGRMQRDTDIGKMDPYCIIEYGGHKYKTRVHKKGGKTPVWGDSFEIIVGSMSDELRFKIMDEDTFSDDTVGYGMVKMSSLCANGGVHDWFSITYDNKIAGQVLFSTKYKDRFG